GVVVGEYLVELYGRDGSDANLEFQGVDYGEHPGVVSVWKTDESTQKILDHICYFPTCTVEGYWERSSRWERPEYYPSCPNVMPTEWLSRTPIYKTFPWWDFEQLPYLTGSEADLPDTPIPSQLQLPVVEVPTYGGDEACADPTLMDPACRFGGGTHVGTITLDFSAAVEALEANIASAPLEANSYHLPHEIPFALTFEPGPGTEMNYADHTLEQHLKHIPEGTDTFCGQVHTDGYLLPD
ncbi:MAG: hypothetical protein VX938_06030, partial [Myxococcota bacterium]|nr:hypothetical protein [Myxococcota bacterium]